MGNSYLKKNPESPGDEYAVFLLNHLVTGQGSPPVEILRVVVNYHEQLLLASQAIEGEPLHRLLAQNPKVKIDPKQFSQMFLMALLIDPEDGKADNYIASNIVTSSGPTTHLIGVDNDHAFVKPFIQKGLFPTKHLFIKTILFCFDQMQEPLHMDVVKNFTTLDSFAVLQEWLESLALYNKRIGQLFNEETLNAYWKEGILVPFFMQPEQVRYLHEKMLRMQYFLSKETKTHLELLKHVNPTVGRLYEAALKRSITPKERFELLTPAAYHRVLDKSQTLTTTAQIKKHLVKVSLDSMEEFRKRNFTPEDSLKILKHLEEGRKLKEAASSQLESASSSGELKRLLTIPDQEELLKKKDWESASVILLEKFAHTPFQKVALRNFKALKDEDLDKFILSCRHPITEEIEIKILDLRGCTELTDRSIEIISKNCPHLEKLYLGQTLLKALALSNNFTPDLRVLSLKDCKQLITLQVSSPLLKRLNLEGCSMLQNLLMDCPYLTSLHIKGCSSLNYTPSKAVLLNPTLFALLQKLQRDEPPVFVLKTQASEAVMQVFVGTFLANTYLKELTIDTFNQGASVLFPLPTKIDLIGHKSLQNLQVRCHSLQSLNVSNSSFLEFLKIESSSLEELNLEDCTSLKVLELNCPSLRWIHLRGCALEKYIPVSMSMAQGQINEQAFQFLHDLHISTLTELEVSSFIEFARVMSWIGHKESKITNVRLSHQIALTKERMTLLTEALRNNNILQSLVIQGNKIAGEELQMLTIALRHKEFLTTLDFRGTELGIKGGVLLAEGLKDGTLVSITHLEMGKKEMSREKITHFMQMLRDSEGLTRIDLAKTNVSLEWIGVLLVILKGSHDLVELNLNENHLSNEGIQAIGESLKDKIHLTHLHLRNTRIGSHGVLALANALEHNTSLMSLDLAGNNLSLEGIKYLSVMLTNKKALKMLSLSNSQIDSDAARTLVKMIEDKQALSILDLSGNKIGAEEWKAVIKALKNKADLTQLNLSNNKIGIESAKTLAKALKDKRNLTKLDLKGNEIGFSGIQSLAKILENKLFLETLDLSGNEISLKGMRILAQKLRSCPTLSDLQITQEIFSLERKKLILTLLQGNQVITRIDFSGSSLSLEWIGFLTEALKSHLSIAEIDLSGNKIDVDKAGLLAEMLTNKNSLKSLYLQNTGMGSEEMVIIANALGSSEDHLLLTHLDLSHNNIDKEGAEALGIALRNKGSLTVLDLSGNSIDAEGIKALVSSLGHKHSLKILDLSGAKMSLLEGRLLALQLKNNPDLMDVKIGSMVPSLEQKQLVLAVLKGDSSITRVDLGGAALSIEWIGFLIGALEEHHALMELDLSHHQINLEIAQLLAEMLANKASLESLVLKDAGMTSQEMSIIAHSIGNKHNLARLDLSGNDIGIEGVGALRQALEDKKSLKILDLRDSEIDMREGQLLALQLKNSPNLIDLNMGGTIIPLEKKQMLLEILKGSALITKVELEGVRLSPEWMGFLIGVLKEHHALTDLDLSDNKINVEIARFLAEMLSDKNGLKSLILKKCSMTSQEGAIIAHSLENKHALVTLDLSGNDIGAEGVKVLTKALENKRFLKALDLRDSARSMEEGLLLAFQLKNSPCLLDLNMGKSALPMEKKQALFKILKGSSSVIKVEGLSLSPEWMGFFIGSLKGNEALTDLYLSDNKINSEIAHLLAGVLINKYALQSLALKKACMGLQEGVIIAKSLESNQVLKNLNLSGNEIGAEGIKELTNALREHRTLTNLNLSGNQIGEQGLKILIPLLKNTHDLMSLDLSFNGIEEEGVKALSIALESNQVLVKLVLSGNKIGLEGAIALAKAIENKKALITLNLQFCSIGHQGVKILAKSLRNKNALAYLNLSNNEIGVKGAKSLAKALKDKRGLLSLNLSCNDIGFRGIKSLAKALGEASGLKNLDFSQNGVGFEGAEVLAKALESKIYLKRLALASNAIGERGLEVLAKVLSDKIHLTTLHLDDNKLGDSAVKFLCEALSKDTALTSLFLSKNDIGKMGIQNLSKLLIANKALVVLDLRDCRYVQGPDVQELIHFQELDVKIPTHLLGYRSFSNQTLLHWAAAAGNIKVVQELLVQKIDMNVKDNQGRRALQLVNAANKELCSLLLDHGAKGGEYILAEKNTILFQDFLTDKLPFGSHLEIKPFQITYTPDFVHALACSSNIISLQLSLIDVRSPSDRSILINALRMNKRLRTFNPWRYTSSQIPDWQELLTCENLVKLKLSSFDQVLSDQVLLKWVVLAGNKKLVAALDEQKININAKGNEGITAFQLALDCADEEMISLLQTCEIVKISFGKKMWEKFYGDVGVEPPLPSNIYQILQAPCPIWPEKRLVDTHLLTLIPEKVNGKPFTLDYLQDLVKNPKNGGNKTQYRYYFEDVKREHGSTSSGSSYWVLMTKDVLPNTRKKPYEENLSKLNALSAGAPQIKGLEKYKTPKSLEAATSILMEYVRSGIRLYSDPEGSSKQWTYTRCEETVKEGELRIAIGGFAASGLYVTSGPWGTGEDGLSGLRRYFGS